MGKDIFCRKVKHSKKDQGEPEAEDKIEGDAPDNEVDESGRACRHQGWWKRGDVETTLNSERKNECIVRLDNLERAFWMGTEVGQLGGYGFQN